jgi:hypothetical protein
MLPKLTCVLAVSWAVGLTAAAHAEPPATRPDVMPSAAAEPEPKPAAARPDGEPVPLNRTGTVLLDRTGKRLLLKTRVVCRECALEMLLCKTQTKEHESILAIDAQAYVIHTGLLALGAKSGKPVQFVRPKPGGEPGEFVEDFRPPSGQKIDIYVQWTDTRGTPRRVRAQDWMRYATRRFFAEPLATMPQIKLPADSELRYDKRHNELSWYSIMSDKQRDTLLALSDDKAYQQAIRALHNKSQVRPMKADFVFAGSGFSVDDQGRRFYQAESGDVICVANFPSAMIDVAVPSTASGEENLLFECWAERIPPLETEVTLELVPVFKDGKPVIVGEEEQPADKERKP